MQLYGLRKTNALQENSNHQKHLVWRCHMKRFVFSHIFKMQVIAQEEMRQLLSTSSELQWCRRIQAGWEKYVQPCVWKTNISRCDESCMANENSFTAR